MSLVVGVCGHEVRLVVLIEYAVFAGTGARLVVTEHIH